MLLAYEGPTRRSGKVKQTVDLRVCSSQGCQLSPTSWVGADVYVQDNVEQGVRTNYLVAQQLRLLDSGDVASTQRVASFLQPIACTLTRSASRSPSSTTTTRSNRSRQTQSAVVGELPAWTRRSATGRRK